MHFGLKLPNNGPLSSAHDIIAIGVMAEKLGFDGLWTNDHIITPSDAPTTRPYGRLFEAFVTLAALSTLTNRVKLGVGVLVLPLREPVLVAKQAATIDAYSNGRMMLGVGVGWEPREYGFLNVEFGRRGKLCDEWLTVIRQVWHGSRINVSSETYYIRDGVSEPKPAQLGGIPVLIGGDSEAALRRAAHLGDGWLAGSHLSIETVAQGVKKVKALSRDEHRGLAYAFRRPSGSFVDPAAVGDMIETVRGLAQVGVQGVVLNLGEVYSSDTIEREIGLFAEKILPQIR